MEMMLHHASTLANERESGQSSLFGGDDEVGGGMPDYAPTEPWDQLEKLAHEFGAVGFYLSAHPLDARMDQLEKMGVPPLNHVEDKISRSPSGRVNMAGILSVNKSAYLPRQEISLPFCNSQIQQAFTR